MALFGEAGPEAIVPLKRGADGNLGIAASWAGAVSM
jgi:phage-related minor tail protein